MIWLVGRWTMMQPMGTSSRARASLAQAMAWRIHSSGVMAILYCTAGVRVVCRGRFANRFAERTLPRHLSRLHEGDERCGDDDQAEDQEAQGFADGFSFHGGE